MQGRTTSRRVSSHSGEEKSRVVRQEEALCTLEKQDKQGLAGVNRSAVQGVESNRRRGGAEVNLVMEATPNSRRIIMLGLPGSELNIRAQQVETI